MQISSFYSGSPADIYIYYLSSITQLTPPTLSAGRKNRSGANCFFVCLSYQFCFGVFFFSGAPCSQQYETTDLPGGLNPTYTQTSTYIDRSHRCKSHTFTRVNQLIFVFFF